jgi:integrase/recombinase XerC
MGGSHPGTVPSVPGQAAASLDVASATEAVIAALVSARGLRSTTLANRAVRMRWLAAFATAHGVPDLDGVTRHHVEDFLRARRGTGALPTPSEPEYRLSAVRLLYREARKLGAASIDPALDIELAPRTPTSARPLTDAEIELGRSHSTRDRDLRPAVCWALAEATARTSEMPHIRVSDLDPDTRTVHVHGGRTTEARPAGLTPWGRTQIERRLRAMAPEEGDNPILMGAGRWEDPDEGRAAATMAIEATLRAARLSAPGVNPRSIPAWAGAAALAGGVTIDAVARLLGVRSLDQAARIVGFNWRGERTR